MTPSRADRRRWTDTYRILSIKGRYWTRTMLRGLVLAQLRALYGKEQTRYLSLYVDQILDDHAFMIWRSGSIPTYTAREICDEAWTRWFDAMKPEPAPAVTK